MSVDTTDLGAAVCRAVMRDLDDRPVALEVYSPRDPARPVYEFTAAPELGMQWSVVLLPLPDMVSVRAHLRYRGMGLWDRAVLSPDAEPSFRELIFVRYPEDAAQITAGPFEAELRDAVGRALEAAEADRARARAGYAAKGEGW